MKKLFNSIGVLLVLLVVFTTGWAIPQFINYQGYLTDDLGNPVADGDYLLAFRIWDAETDGNQLWSEDHTTVTVARGLFNVVLGSYSPLELSFDVDYWLGVQVEGEPELPRVRLTSVGYSYRAGFADTAEYALEAQRDDDWLPDTSGLHIYRSGGNVGIGMVSLDSRLGVAGTAEVTGFKMATGASSGHVLTSDGSGVGAWQPPSGSGYWILEGGILSPSGNYGLAMRLTSALYGFNDSTHVNLGVACTTGASGLNNAYCTVGGGRQNAASEWYATVSGGYLNSATEYYSTVCGGNDNAATENGASVGGGSGNVASGYYAFLGGGWNNLASGNRSTVGGGQDNEARGRYATIGGGWQNTADSACATVGGGRDNTADSSYTTIGGGVGNTAIGYGATVGGGTANDAIGSGATVSGGSGCETIDHYGTVGGGFVNVASGFCATVAGGSRATAAGDYSCAGGRDVTVDDAGHYTLAYGRDFTTSAANAVVFHNSVDPIRVSIGAPDPTATLDVHGLTGHDQLRMRTSFTPSGTADTLGNVGDLAWDEDYVYVKTSAGWKRASLTTW